MFGNVTALEGLHVTGKYRTKPDAHMLQACGSEILQPPPLHARPNPGKYIFLSESGNENYEVCKSQGGVPREQKVLKGHLLRVIYHQVY